MNRKIQIECIDPNNNDKKINISYVNPEISKTTAYNFAANYTDLTNCTFVSANIIDTYEAYIERRN